MDKSLRAPLRNMVTVCRKLLESAIYERLEGQFGIFQNGKIEETDRLGHLSAEDQVYREQLLIHLDHIEAGGIKPKEAVEQLIREVAFTHLNRLCAYKLMESRGLVRESVSKGLKSQGFFFFLADHPEDEALSNTGDSEKAYRHFLRWLGGTLSQDIGTLFSEEDPANRLYPPQRVLNQVLELLNTPELTQIWTEDETIGWVYQYFTPKELRDKARKESSSPRNSYELAFRNQFYTPRYVVEFLTDNTLGRTWYEMRQAQTQLTQNCRYLVRRKHPIFLVEGQEIPLPFIPTQDNIGDPDLPGEMWLRPNPEFEDINQIFHYGLTAGGYDYARKNLGVECGDLANERLRIFRETGKWEGTFEELRCCLFFEQRRYHHLGQGPEGKAAEEILDLYQNVCKRWDIEADLIPFRPIKDPRDLKILDPACGSGHFLLYCFDLLLQIYEEAWDDCPELFIDLRGDINREDFLQRVPGMILRHNLHGIDIDLRATQIASLALWLRAQKAYQEIGLKREQRPPINRSNIVCAEPMPGEDELLEEFCQTLNPPLIGQLVKTIFTEMKVAGEIGSLLKIEEELRDAIQAAKQQLVEQPSNVQMTFWPEAPKPKQLMFDLSGIGRSDSEFWRTVEGRVLEALQHYANQASNGQNYQRRLFAADSKRGFFLIDVLKNNYDVILANPPYGDFCEGRSFEYIQKKYPQSWTDIYAAFIDRIFNLLINNGKAGLLTSSTFLTSKQLKEFRQTRIPDLLANHGQGVLDNAAVETASWVLSADKLDTYCLFFELFGMEIESQPNSLLEMVSDLQNGNNINSPILQNINKFDKIPNAPFAYYLSPKLLALWEENPCFDPDVAEIAAGITTFDNERFLRLRQEIPQEEIGNRYIYIAKGGGYQPFITDEGLFVDWFNDGQLLQENEFERYGTNARTTQSKSFWYKEGLTFSNVSSAFSARILPKKCLFTTRGMGIFLRRNEDLFSWLGFLNSSIVDELLSAFSRGRMYEIRSVAGLPIPKYIDMYKVALATLTKNAIDLILHLESADETSIFFITPFISDVNTEGSIADILKKIEKISIACYFNDASYETKFRNIKQDWLFEKRDVGDQISYLLGITFGRWDIRIGCNNKLAPVIFNNSLEFPIQPISLLVTKYGKPANINQIVSEDWLRARSDATTFPEINGDQLVGKDGKLHPASISDDEYPIRIAWDGILVDDPDNPNDIVTRSHDVLETLFGDRAESVELEACQILAVKSLREYFRKSSNGGFWMDHVKRYSKSRRKAPIYWLLQSNRKNYAVWLYYHRLDKDLLFKILTQYVEPKIRLEEERLKSIRSQRSQFGTGGKQAKDLDKDIEHQENFLIELEDFRDKLRRTGDLGLEPDLNDGVVLNIAPLWELVPWGEAKKYWDELMEGKYEWSGIGKQLRAKGLVK